METATERFLRLMLEKYTFRLNKGGMFYIWTHNIDHKQARKYLKENGYRSRLRYSFCLRKLQLRRKLQIKFSSYSW